MVTWKQLLNNFAFRENRPQWLIAPLPVTDQAQFAPAPPFAASMTIGGLLPNIAQKANTTPQFVTSPYHPYYSADDFAAAQEYTNRVSLSPIGGEF